MYTTWRELSNAHTYASAEARITGIRQIIRPVRLSTGALYWRIKPVAAEDLQHAYVVAGHKPWIHGAWRF